MKVLQVQFQTRATPPSAVFPDLFQSPFGALAWMQTPTLLKDPFA